MKKIIIFLILFIFISVSIAIAECSFDLFTICEFNDRCPICVQEGKKSVVLNQGSKIKVNDEKNICIYICDYCCSNGHEFSTKNGEIIFPNQQIQPIGTTPAAD